MFLLYESHFLAYNDPLYDPKSDESQPEFTEFGGFANGGVIVLPKSYNCH